MGAGGEVDEDTLFTVEDVEEAEREVPPPLQASAAHPVLARAPSNAVAAVCGIARSSQEQVDAWMEERRLARAKARKAAAAAAAASAAGTAVGTHADAHARRGGAPQLPDAGLRAGRAAGRVVWNGGGGGHAGAGACAHFAARL
jgi:hypothetical protein